MKIKFIFINKNYDQLTLDPVGILHGCLYRWSSKPLLWTFSIISSTSWFDSSSLNSPLVQIGWEWITLQLLSSKLSWYDWLFMGANFCLGFFLILILGSTVVALLRLLFVAGCTKANDDGRRRSDCWFL